MSSRSRSRSQNRQDTLQSDEYGYHILAEPRHVEFSERDWEGQGGVQNIKVSRARRAPTPWPSVRQKAEQPRGYAGSALIVPECSVKENWNKEDQQRAEGIAASRSHNPSATEQPLPQQAGQLSAYAYGILMEPEYKRKVTPSEEGRQRAGAIAAARSRNPSATEERLQQEAEQYRPRSYEIPAATRSFDPGPYYRGPRALQPREEINPPPDYRVRSSATSRQESARPAPSQQNRIVDLRGNESWLTERTRFRDAGLGRKYKEIPDGN